MRVLIALSSALLAITMLLPAAAQPLPDGAVTYRYLDSDTRVEIKPDGAHGPIEHRLTADGLRDPFLERTPAEIIAEHEAGKAKPVTASVVPPSGYRTGVSAMSEPEQVAAELFGLDLLTAHDLKAPHVVRFRISEFRDPGLSVLWETPYANTSPGAGSRQVRIYRPRDAIDPADIPNLVTDDRGLPMFDVEALGWDLAHILFGLSFAFGLDTDLPGGCRGTGAVPGGCRLLPAEVSPNFHRYAFVHLTSDVTTGIAMVDDFIAGAEAPVMAIRIAGRDLKTLQWMLLEDCPTCQLIDVTRPEEFWKFDRAAGIDASGFAVIHAESL